MESWFLKTEYQISYLLHMNQEVKRTFTTTHGFLLECA